MSMQALPDPGHRPFGRPELRIGDAERDRVCAALADHFQAGRLTAEEFDQRVGSAVRAVTEGDLRRLVIDLPAAPVSGPTTERTPAPSAGGAPSAFDVLFCLLGVMAGLSLMLLFLLAGSRYVGFGFLACVGGATVAAVATHIVHRAVGVRRN